MLAIRFPASELVFEVNEAVRSRPRASRRREGRGRGLSQQLCLIAARLEQSNEYQRSLRRMLDVSAALQASFDAAQRALWLDVEEAMLDHARRLNREYYLAGLRRGWRRGLRAEGRESQCSSTSQYRSADPDVIVALTQVIRRLVGRR